MAHQRTGRTSPKRRVATAALGALLLAGASFAAPAPSTANATSTTNGATSGVTSSNAAPSTQRAGRAKLERQVLRITNKKRKAHGCSPLRANTKLRKAARKHSARMAKAQNLSHQLPGEPRLSRRVEKVGYRNWTALAENIAYGQPTARDVMSDWMGSSGHRRNILDCRLQHLGVGVVIGDGATWWTQDFGSK